MAQFDVHRNEAEETKAEFPYLLNIQSDILDHLPTRVILPLVPASVAGRPVSRLNPVLEIEDQDMIVATGQIAGVPIRDLGQVVACAQDRRFEVIAAIDLLISGF